MALPAGTREDGAMTTAVYLETGKRRVFASALDWPGWCRSARTEELALATLADYAARYAPVSAGAGLVFPGDVDFAVVERLPGSASTDFGVPEQFATVDTEPLDPATGAAMTALVESAWRIFDRVAAQAPAELSKGPRGGGRDRDKMIEHVLASDNSYARKLGVKHRLSTIDDRAAIVALRTAVAAALAAAADGAPSVPGGWPARYAARRFAWHVLDHAWEMQDRAAG
jgi:hypothetical protein